MMQFSLQPMLQLISQDSCSQALLHVGLSLQLMGGDFNT